jgi:hypothetical protein
MVAEKNCHETANGRLQTPRLERPIHKRIGSSGSAPRGRDKGVRVKVGNGETQVVVAPNQIAMLEAEGAELVWLEKGAHFGMLRVPQKGPEVDSLFGTVVERQAKTIVARLLDARDVDDW